MEQKSPQARCPLESAREPRSTSSMHAHKRAQPGARAGAPASSRLVGAAHAWTLRALRGLRPQGRLEAGAPSTIEVGPISRKWPKTTTSRWISPSSSLPRDGGSDRARDATGKPENRPGRWSSVSRRTPAGRGPDPRSPQGAPRGANRETSVQDSWRRAGRARAWWPSLEML